VVIARKLCTRLSKPIHGKALAGEGTHGRAVDYGAPEIRVLQAPLTGQIAHQPAGERIPGARRVEHLFQRVARGEKGRGGGEEDGPVLSLLDDYVTRTPFLDPARGTGQVEVAGELAGLRVVHQEEVHPSEQL
jgi:hypothetical protein